ncbi:MAG: hypothetical protein J5631_04810 [Spirochaetaceae bacterium]|nr:hypothetical protein [Spirochaetaceae bacterium]
MKKTAIVTGGTSKQYPAMAVLALNIADKCPDIADELVIFYDDIPLSQQKLINSIFPTRFIKYESPFQHTDNFSDEILHYFSPFVFCKYECFRLLEEYQTVIWSDYDFVITKDISDIRIKNKFDAKFISDVMLGAKFNNKMYFEPNCLEDIHSFDLLGPAISCCFFVLFDTFKNYKEIYEECIKLTERYAPALYLPEEAVISVIFQQKKVQYEKLDYNKYSTLPKDIEKNAGITSIIHAVGQPKFWNGLYNEQWENYYSEWLKMGGAKHLDRYTKLERLILRIKRKIKKIFNKN